MNTKMRIRAIGAVCALCTAFAAPAYAQDPTLEGYSPTPPLGQIEEEGGNGTNGGGNGGGGSNEPRAADDAGNLPFTGLDLGIAAAMGLTLLGTGLVIRRTARQPS